MDKVKKFFTLGLIFVAVLLAIFIVMGIIIGIHIFWFFLKVIFFAAIITVAIGGLRKMFK